jgi:hypothetical protein
VALRTAAETIEQKKPGPRCGMGKILQYLNADDTAYFAAMVEEGRTNTYIAEVFREDGHQISHFTVRRHLTGQCSCR